MKAKDEFKVGEHDIGWLDSNFFGKFFDPNKYVVPAMDMPTYWTLGNSQNDKKNEAAPRTKKCTLGDVLFVLDSALQELKDGKPNIFYLEACVVGVLDEVEPVEVPMYVNLNSITDACVWAHALPRVQK